MQVRAQRAGFFGADFKPAGAIFSVPDGTTASWFVPVAAPQTGAQAADSGKPQGQQARPPAPQATKPRRAKSGAGSPPASAPAAPAPDAPDLP